jgi:hypothetical protein
MGVPTTECPLQRIARNTLDNCDVLKVITPRERAEAVVAAFVSSDVAGSRSAARLLERIMDSTLR